MWDNFLGAPPANEEGGGGNVRLHMSLQIGAPKKKRKTAANEMSRGGSAGEERTFARLRLFGREVLPAHLSARPPAVPHTHGGTHT